MILRARISFRQILSKTLLVIGVGCLGVWSGSILYSNFRQMYDGWRFDRERGAAPQPEAATAPLPLYHSRSRVEAAPAHVRAPRMDEVVGRVEIPRLHLSAMVEEGTDDGTLSRAVGHIAGTALPGASGNVGIAGHRDSFFRALKDLQRDDEIIFETARGTYRYTVDQMTVVDPKDTAALAPTRDKTLTIVTCFPFYYIGPAPRRFIVRARQVAELSKWSPAAGKSATSRAENSLPE